MVVRTKVRVTEVACGFREPAQVIERALLACERDQRKMYTELHVSLEVRGAYSSLNPRKPRLGQRSSPRPGSGNIAERWPWATRALVDPVKAPVSRAAFSCFGATLRSSRLAVAR